MQGVSLGLQIEFADRRAWLHLGIDDAIADELGFDNSGRTFEGVVGCRAIAEHGVERNVAGRLVPNDRRIGLSFHYMPTQTRQIVGDWDSAALVRGDDKHGHFTHTPRPEKDFDPAVTAFHEKATTAVRDVLFHDAAKVRKTI